MADEWYRRTSWTEADRNEFFRRLTRARPENRAQYLAIQAGTLTKSTEPEGLNAALELTARIIREHPDYWVLAGVHDDRAVCHEKLGQIDPALACLRESLACQRARPSLRTQAHLTFARLVTDQQRFDLYDEAFAILEESGSESMLPVEARAFHTLRATLATQLGLTADAASSSAQARAVENAIAAEQERAAQPRPVNADYRGAVDKIQRALTPWLASFGFRTRGRSFNRTTADGLTHVITIQMGAFEPPGAPTISGVRSDFYGLFTINLGVFIPEVALYHGGGTPKGWIQEYHCALRARLSEVCPEPGDAWWPAEATADVIDDVRKGLQANGVPWLDQFGERDAILRRLAESAHNRWMNPPRIVSAIIHAARGESAEAKALLSAQEHDARVVKPHPGHAQYVRELAAKLGLGPLE